MNRTLQPVPERRNVDGAVFRQEIAPAYRPVVMRGLVADWPAVREGRSPEAMVRYLAAHDSGRPVETFVGPPSIGGRFFYRDDMRGLNFERRPEGLRAVLERLLGYIGQDNVPSVYVGAAAMPEHAPAFAAENVLELVDRAVPARLWVGNAVTVSTHFDLSDNIACVVSGRRRFTLFPPSELANLYVGPLDFTLAGQPVSMAPLDPPDLERFPRFEQALAAAETAELEPGDAIYIPPLWWHHVVSTEPFNVLVNYWWNEAGTPGSPFDVLVHGLMAIRHLPPPQRRAWRKIFDHYVFEPEEASLAHLAPEHRGVLGPMTPQLARRIRSFLLNSLGRG